MKTLSPRIPACHLPRLTLALLALAPALLLPGCASNQATPEAATEPAASLTQLASAEQRLASLEATFGKLSLTAQQAKDQGADALAQGQGLATRLAGLDERLLKLEQRLAGTEAQASRGEARIEGTLVESVTLTGDKYMYPLNAVELDQPDCAQLDQLATRLKALGHPYYLEIQGHTDDSGHGEYNYLLGEARANAVRRYLHTAGGVPLHRMAVISYGAHQILPGSERGNPEKSSRRVVILVLK